MASKKLAKPENETRLEQAVRLWLNDKGRDYDNGWRGALKDLQYGGCSSGIVSGLIYYSDTVKFYRQNREEIVALLVEAFEKSGFYDPAKLFGDKWDEKDPLAFDDTNQNLLAWFGFEETASRIEGREEVAEAA
jgi:hypothetical protein